MGQVQLAGEKVSGTFNWFPWGGTVIPRPNRLLDVKKVPDTFLTPLAFS